ncbi:hypothetical protein GGR52DRAFT_545236 [Hypoxylon sp. FL1284]|nr:hypothetical protein GGR52DRAFT_545236 [Hypoxylon sp. FL1284]
MHSFSVAAVVSLLAGSALSQRIVTYDCTDTPQICLNTCWAVNCVGHPNPLHGGSQRAPGRTEWGYNQGPCQNYGWAWTTPDGKAATSPDEYPLASSYEGGWEYQGRVVSLRCVPSNEQSKQGRKTQGIRTSPNTETWTFRWTRINNLRNLGGNPAPDWCEATRNCVNDGHQFVPANNGQFVLDSPNMLIQRSNNSNMRWSDDGDTAELTARIEGNNIVPVPFEG